MFWGTKGLLVGMNLGGLAPTVLHDNSPRFAYGMTADDASLYYIDADLSLGFDRSTISRIPAGGGAATTLASELPFSFPIIAFGDFVYFASGSSIQRVPKSGGTVEDLVDGVIGGFAVSSNADGHTILYWTDDTHGGLVWRGRLD